MKFLGKSNDSKILREGKIYRKGHTQTNADLRLLLLAEQRNFCAYSEKYVDGLDSVEVEHFNPELKNNDDYFNYYAALRDCNQNNQRNYPKYKGAPFFTSLFFHNGEVLNARMEYIDGQYIEKNADDQEMRDLIDFLGFNRIQLYKHRQAHIKRLKDTFRNGGYTTEEQLEHFRKHKQDLNFITAIEIELNLDLSEFYQ